MKVAPSVYSGRIGTFGSMGAFPLPCRREGIYSAHVHNSAPYLSLIPGRPWVRCSGAVLPEFLDFSDNLTGAGEDGVSNSPKYPSLAVGHRVVAWVRPFLV